MSQICEHKNLALENIDEPVVLFAAGFETSCTATIEIFEKHEDLEQYAGYMEGGERCSPDIKGDLIATFNAQIEVTEGENTIVIDEEPQLPTFHETVDTKTTTIRYTFNNETDSEEFEIPIPFAQAEREGEYLEISAVVTVGDKTYTTGIATIPFSTPSGAILTYITGRLTDGYFENATYYWKYRHRSDYVADHLTIENVNTSYLTLKDIVKDIHQFQQAHPYISISQVNIVAHGNPTGVNLRPSAEINGSGDYNNRLDSANIQEKLSALAADMTNSPSNQFATTTNVLIVFRGCNFGQNSSLLSGFKRFWGNNVTVKAPRYSQFYHTNSIIGDNGVHGVPIEFFKNHFILHFKPTIQIKSIIQNGETIQNKETIYFKFERTNPPPDQKLKICQKLSAKYGSNSRIFNISSWESFYDEIRNRDSEDEIKNENETFSLKFEVSNKVYINNDGSIKNDFLLTILREYWEEINNRQRNFKKVMGEAEDWDWEEIQYYSYLETYHFEGTKTETTEDGETEYSVSVTQSSQRRMNDQIQPTMPTEDTTSGITSNIIDEYSWILAKVEVEAVEIEFEKLKSSVLHIESKLVNLEILDPQPPVSERKLVIPDLESWGHYGEM